uniref:(California timema) hypothetical protein n=1 Tax=Timema californicum TaxID=61474 RepID=A0A7R9P4Q5_TIMCA|nr:unnamed protein product [Timema californicum]
MGYQISFTRLRVTTVTRYSDNKSALSQTTWLGVTVKTDVLSRATAERGHTHSWANPCLKKILSTRLPKITFDQVFEGKTCCSAVHKWTESCTRASLEMAWSCFIGANRFFIPIYVMVQASLTSGRVECIPGVGWLEITSNQPSVVSHHNYRSDIESLPMPHFILCTSRDLSPSRQPLTITHLLIKLEARGQEVHQLRIFKEDAGKKNDATAKMTRVARGHRAMRSLSTENTKNLTGFSHYLTVFVPALVGGLGIFFEHHHKRGFLASSYAGFVLEYIVRQLQEVGLIRFTVARSTALFMVSNAIMLYLLRSESFYKNIKKSNNATDKAYTKPTAFRFKMYVLIANLESFNTGIAKITPLVDVKKSSSDLGLRVQDYGEYRPKPCETDMVLNSSSRLNRHVEQTQPPLYKERFEVDLFHSAVLLSRITQLALPSGQVLNLAQVVLRDFHKDEYLMCTSSVVRVPIISIKNDRSRSHDLAYSYVEVDLTHCFAKSLKVLGIESGTSVSVSRSSTHSTTEVITHCFAKSLKVLGIESGTSVSVSRSSTHSTTEVIMTGKYGGLGLALQLFRKLLPQMKCLWRTPSDLVKRVYNRNNLLFGAYLAGYVGLYTVTSCVLCRVAGQDSALHAIPAGFLAGLVYPLQPNTAIVFTTVGQTSRGPWSGIPLAQNDRADLRVVFCHLDAWPGHGSGHVFAVRPRNEQYSHEWMEQIYLLHGGLVDVLKEGHLLEDQTTIPRFRAGTITA